MGLVDAEVGEAFVNSLLMAAGTAFFGSTGSTAGGTIVIESGGIYELTTSNTWAMDGAGSTLRSMGIVSR